MNTYSSLYNLFSWIHIQSYKGLVFAGYIFSFVLKCLCLSKYRSILNEYMDYIHRANIPYDRREFKAVLICVFVYGVSVKEFYLYQFAKLNDSGRRDYITERNRYNIYPYFNGAKKRIEMQDKYRAYLSFKEYYKRDAMLIDDNTSVDEIEDFFRDRDTAILKPNMSGVGKGVELFRLSTFETREAAYSYLLSKRDFIMEEVVHQSGLMKDLHPQSVNTVRVYACRLKTRIEIFGCHLRIGVGESVVDNAGRGGVIVSIDNDGIAWRSGMDEFGHTYVFHPDTHVFIPGIKIPEWDQAIRLINKAMLVHPDIRFVGWDIAYTDRGWVIIEANDNGQFHGYQIPHHKGVRKQMMAYVKEL